MRPEPSCPRNWRVAPIATIRFLTKRGLVLCGFSPMVLPGSLQALPQISLSPTSSSSIAASTSPFYGLLGS